MTITRRRFNQYVLGALGALALPNASAGLVEGKDWRPVTPPQPSDTEGKIEVLEFFSYGCPHCAELRPIIEPWAKGLPEDVSFRHVPVSFARPAWASLCQLFYALEETGHLEELNEAVFEALQKERLKLYTEPQILEWIASKGVDRETFAAALNSFDVQTKANRADYLAGKYQIDAVPTITVAGKYAVLGKAVSGLPDLLAIADQLIAKARAESNPNPVATPPGTDTKR